MVNIKKTGTNTTRTAAALAITIALSACGGGGGGDAPTGSNPASTSPTQTSNNQFKTGVFLDSPVQGLSVVNQSGATVTTGIRGQFQYVAGDTLSFYLGPLKLGTVLAKAEITPLDLFKTLDTADRRVVNLLRLVQALDSNDDLTDGIQLDKQTLINAGSDLSKLSFDIDTSVFQSNINVSAILAKKRPGLTLPSVLSAKTHFDATLALTKSTGVFNGDLTFGGNKFTTKGLGGVLSTYSGNYTAQDGKSYTVTLIEDTPTTARVTVYSKSQQVTSSGTFNLPTTIEDTGTLNKTSSEIHFVGTKGITLNVVKDSSSTVFGTQSLYVTPNSNSVTICKNGMLTASIPPGYGVIARQYIGMAYVANTGLKFAIKPIASFGDDQIIEGDLNIKSSAIEFSLPEGKFTPDLVNGTSGFYFNICS